MNYKTCCRLCLNECPNLQDLFSSHASTGLIATISELTGVKIVAIDRVSTRVCDACTMVILNFETFKTASLQNQLKLLQRLSEFDAADLNHSIQIKDEPPDEEDDVVYVPNPLKNQTLSSLTVASPPRDDDQPPMLSPNLPTAMELLQNNREPNISSESHQEDVDMDDETLIQAEEIIEEDQQQHDKILFAAGLQLQSRKFSSVNREPMTSVELSYARKHALVYSQCATYICCCHNDLHDSRRKFFKHIKYYGKLHLPLNSCYKCCTTFGPRADACKHRVHCSKKELEAFPHAFSTEERGVNKHRLYQTFTCVKCHANYRVFEEYCKHIDKHIADADFECICGKNVGHAYTYKHHVFMSCLLHYTCDVCGLRFESIEGFKEHCAQMHDKQEGETYDIHEGFVVQDIHSEKAYACVECNLKCAKEQTIIGHLQQEHNYDLESATKMSIDCYVGGTSSAEEMPPLVADGTIDSNENIKPPTGSTGLAKECDICHKSFGSHANLRRHKEEVHYMRRRLANYRCGDCNESFNTSKILEDHLETHHSYPCESCNAKYTTEAELDLHRRSHLRLSLTREPGTKNYKTSRCCEQCSTTFQTDEELEEHMQAHEDEMPPLFKEDPRDLKSLQAQCKFCKRLFVGPRGLAVHIGRQHGSAVLERDEINKFPKTCAKCGEVIRSINDWFQHMKGHEREELPEEKKPGTLDCDECGKHFAGKKYLKRHMRLHGVNFFCADCRFKTNEQDEWQTHLELHQKHNIGQGHGYKGPVSTFARRLPNGKFHCRECGKIANTLESMRVHVGWHKRAPKMFESVPKEDANDVDPEDADDGDDEMEPPTVNLAGMFNEKQGKSFVCINCGELFPHQQVLQSHLIAVHGKDNKGKRHTTIQCVLCNVNFASVEEFTEHDRIHLMADKNNSQCRLCGKILARIDNLREHMKNLHKLVEILHCPYCSFTVDKRFAYHTHVREHKMQTSATDEREVIATWKSLGTAKFTCSICDLGFNSATTMRGHIISEHPFF